MVRGKREQAVKVDKQLEIVYALSWDYFSIYLIDLDKDATEVQRISNEVSRQVSEFTTRFHSYSKGVVAYTYAYVYPEDKEFVLKETRIENIKKRLETERAFSIKYRRIVNGVVEYIEWRYVRGAAYGEESEVILAVRNVNEEMSKEIQQKELLEDALNQAQHANRAKTTFLSNMSHDIRAPMNAIIGFSTIAANHIDNREKVKDCLEKILSSSKHLLSLINDILDMSRIESGKVTIQEKECNISEMLHSLVRMIQPQIKEKELDFFVDIYDVVNEDIIADSLKLNQVFINILSNAVKFTPSGGVISFRICQKASTREGYGAYEFAIKDTGVGMSSEFVEHIFEPFEREKSSTQSGIEGTGLGMSIAKNIVDMMGGTIQVNSVKGKGSEFVICLELKLQENVVKREPIAELENMRILVADDDVDTCNSLRKMLAQMGIRSECVNSAGEAIAQMQVAVDAEDAFDTYIINWKMPDMDGIETTRRIRKVIGAAAPIIILTAHDWTEIEDEAKESGVTAFCSKPLFRSDLEKILLRLNRPKEEEKVSEPSLREQYVGKRILVAEDNILNREIAHEILTEAGFEVEEAKDGSDALQMIERSGEGYYDLVLMDVLMPVMNGYEATKLIRKLPRMDIRTMPIIAMTAKAFEEDKELALQSGMNAHIAKPLNVEKLFHVLSNWLQQVQ